LLLLLIFSNTIVLLAFLLKSDCYWVLAVRAQAVLLPC